MSQNPEPFIWSTDERAAQRATFLAIIRSIVERYGGSLSVDFENSLVNLDVPEEVKFECCVAIDKALSAYGC